MAGVTCFPSQRVKGAKATGRGQGNTPPVEMAKASTSAPPGKPNGMQAQPWALAAGEGEDSDLESPVGEAAEAAAEPSAWEAERARPRQG